MDEVSGDAVSQEAIRLHLIALPHATTMDLTTCLIFPQQRVELGLKKRFEDIAMQDVEGRIMLLHPAMWDPPGAQTGENPVVQFYTGIKAAWQDRVVGSASTVWDVDPSSILASYEYCAE